VPLMKLIVEVKFLCGNDKITKVIDEIGSDASLYLKERTDYAGIVVAFIWDDSRRTPRVR
jgi:hypothetical protein